MPVQHSPASVPATPVSPDGAALSAGRDWAGPRLPLSGITILAVEDSRFACDLLRLMCQRLGARLRRAETIRAARAHLKVYRPDVALIDLGLPDGRGEALIRDLALTGAPPVVLGTSGDPDGRRAALAAGASGFLAKPIASVAAFRDLLLDHLPDRAARRGAAVAGDDTPVHPDPLALHDDLAHAAALIDGTPDADQRRYLSGFLAGIGRSAEDPALEAAARAAGDPAGLSHLTGLVAARMKAQDGPI